MGGLTVAVRAGYGETLDVRPFELVAADGGTPLPSHPFPGRLESTDRIDRWTRSARLPATP